MIPRCKSYKHAQGVIQLSEGALVRYLEYTFYLWNQLSLLSCAARSRAIRAGLSRSFLDVPLQNCSDECTRVCTPVWIASGSSETLRACLLDGMVSG